MQADNDELPQGQPMVRVSQAMGDIRDSMVMMSLALQDLMAATSSPERDAAIAQVQSLLKRWRDASKSP
jgi:hypothetical protein